MRWKKRDADGAGAVKGTLNIVNTEGLSEDEKREFYATVSETLQLDLYTGHVKHGYSVDAVATQASCPRCHALTRQQVANFIYATQIAPRVMVAPAGYFSRHARPWSLMTPSYDLVSVNDSPIKGWWA